MNEEIIIADISADSALRTRTLLSDLGYAAHVTHSAAEALQACRELNPTILLASSQLPDMDTCELLQLLKQSNGDFETIVICPRQTLPSTARHFKPLLSGIIGSPVDAE